jgi:hypothetical protein
MSIQDESFVMDQDCNLFTLGNGGGKEVRNDDLFWHRLSGSSMEDVPTGGGRDSGRGTEPGWCRRLGP